MTDRVRCDSCKQMVLTEWPHSCYDFDAVERVRQCERAVVDAARRFVTHGVLKDVEALYDAIEALDSAEREP